MEHQEEQLRRLSAILNAPTMVVSNAVSEELRSFLSETSSGFDCNDRIKRLTALILKLSVAPTTVKESPRLAVDIGTLKSSVTVDEASWNEIAQKSQRGSIVKDISGANAMPFLTFDNQKRWVVSKEAKLFLTNLKQPIAVVSVAGVMRGGKSFLLNLLCGKMRGFALGSSVSSCTKGTYLRRLVDGTFRDDNGRPFVVLVMDCEGMFDSERPNAHGDYDTALFMFATLLSSLVLYNTLSRSDNQQLNQLSLVSNLGAQLMSNSKGDKPTLPKLLWVLRDFSLEMSESPDQYLENILAPPIDDNEDMLNPDKRKAEDRKLGRIVKKLFPKRALRTLPRPLASESDLRDIEKIPMDQLQPEFLRQVEQLTTEVKRDVRPITMDVEAKDAKPMTGPDYLVYVESVLEKINDKKIVSIEDSWLQVSTLACQRGRKDSCAEYTNAINERMQVPANRPLTSDNLRALHDELCTGARTTYNSIAVPGCAAYQAEFAALTQDIHLKYKAACEENLALSAETSKQWMKTQQVRVLDGLAKAPPLYTDEKSLLAEIGSVQSRFAKSLDLGPYPSENQGKSLALQFETIVKKAFATRFSAVNGLKNQQQGEVDASLAAAKRSEAEAQRLALVARNLEVKRQNDESQRSTAERQAAALTETRRQENEKLSEQERQRATLEVEYNQQKQRQLDQVKAQQDASLAATRNQHTSASQAAEASLRTQIAQEKQARGVS